jgi:hypothetical protein
MILINNKPITTEGRLHVQSIIAPGDHTRHGSVKCFRAETEEEAQAAIGRWERFNNETTTKKIII